MKMRSGAQEYDYDDDQQHNDQQANDSQRDGDCFFKKRRILFGGHGLKPSGGDVKLVMMIAYIVKSCMNAVYITVNSSAAFSFPFCIGAAICWKDVMP